MSPFVQLVALTIANQLAGALTAYGKKCGAATGLTPEQVARYSVYVQVGNNLQTAIKAGMTAATAEFNADATIPGIVVAGEKAVAAALATLPPIT